MIFSLNDFTSAIDRIAEQVIANGQPIDYIVGIARGGLVPAVVLSHRLELPMRSVSWSTFHPDQMREHAYDIADDILSGKRILVVDDILDSGRTIQELIDDWGCQRSQFDLAVLIHNTDQPIVPNYYGIQIQRSVTTEWVDFFWEKWT